MHCRHVVRRLVARGSAPPLRPQQTRGQGRDQRFAIGARALVAIGLLLWLDPCGSYAQQAPFRQPPPAQHDEVERLPPVARGEWNELPPSDGQFTASILAPSDDGPVFGGFDGPEEVSPAYGGRDVPADGPPPHAVVGPSASPAVGDPAQDWLGQESRLRAEFCEFKDKVFSDYRIFYSWPTMRDMALGFGLGAILANTPIDQDFRDWYQEDVRCSGTDDVSTFFKTFGEGKYFIPGCAGLMLLNVLCDDMPVLGIAGDFGDRATRAYLVGAPPMLLMQLVTGASRPGEASWDSQWRPFDDNNGVSGHAFMGAVPFITAAQMTDSFVLKCGFYILSTFTAWSRVNDDDHYLSQAALGWWMAYLACRSVNETNHQRRLATMVPIVTPEMTGVGIIIER